MSWPDPQMRESINDPTIDNELIDDAKIDNDEILYRRIPNVEQGSFMVIDEATKVRRPTSAVSIPTKTACLCASTRF